MKCDGTLAETRFRLSTKLTSPFKSAGASFQSTTGSRGVRISGSNAGYTMFRGSVKGTGYPLHSPVSPLNSPPVRHRVSSHFNWILPRFTVIRWTLSAMSSRVRPHAIPCGICGGNGENFFFPAANTSIFNCQYYSIIAPHSFVHSSPTISNLRE